MLGKIEDSIKRIIRQQNGDPSFFYLAILSFFEGYLRKECNIQFLNSNKDDGKLPNIIETYISKNGYTEDSEEIKNLENFKAFHTSYGKRKVKGSRIIVDSDRIRHEFAEQDINIIPLLVSEFIQFAQNNHFYDEKLFEPLENGEYLKVLKEKLPPVSNKIFEDINRKLNILSKKYSKNIEEFEQLQKDNTEKNLRIEKLEEDISIFTNIDQDNTKTIENLKKEISDLTISKNRDADEYQDLILQLLDYSAARRDFDSRIINLTESQMKIVTFIINNLDKPELLNKDFLITGGPGTGKTLILIECLRLIYKQQKTVKLVTFTDSLCKYNKYLTKKYNIKDSNLSNYEPLLENIDTIDNFFKSFAKETALNKTLIDINDYRDSLINKIDSINNSTFTSQSILEQAIYEIWPNCLSLEDYSSGTYVVKNKAFKETEKRQRKEIWNIINELDKILESDPLWPKEYAYWKLSNPTLYEKFETNKFIDILLIDEVQDLSRSQIKSLSYIVNGTCILAGDGNQTIYQKYDIPWKDLNINVKGHSKILKTNLRSTVEIQTFANIYREKMPLKDKMIYSEGILPGQSPELFITNNFEDTAKSIKNYVDFCISQLYFNERDICIICSSYEELHSLNEIIPKSVIIDSPSFTFEENVIRLSTLKYVKGIDSPIVIMCLTEKTLDEGENGNLRKNNQMNAIYSSITRAMDILRIYVTKSIYEKDKTNALSILVDVYKSAI